MTEAIAEPARELGQIAVAGANPADLAGAIETSERLGLLPATVLVAAATLSLYVAVWVANRWKERPARLRSEEDPGVIAERDHGLTPPRSHKHE